MYERKRKREEGEGPYKKYWLERLAMRTSTNDTRAKPTLHFGDGEKTAGCLHS